MRQNIFFKRKDDKKKQIPQEIYASQSRQKEFNKFHIFQQSNTQNLSRSQNQSGQKNLQQFRLSSVQKSKSEISQRESYILEQSVNENICYTRHKSNQYLLDNPPQIQDKKRRRSSFVDFNNHLFQVMNWKQKKIESQKILQTQQKKGTLVYKPKKQSIFLQSLNNQGNGKKKNQRPLLLEFNNKSIINENQKETQNDEQFQAMPILINGKMSSKYDVSLNMQVQSPKRKKPKQFSFTCTFCQRQNTLRDIQTNESIRKYGNKLKQLHNSVKKMHEQTQKQIKKMFLQMNSQILALKTNLSSSLDQILSQKLQEDSHLLSKLKQYSMKSTRQPEMSQYFGKKQHPSYIENDELQLFRRVESGQNQIDGEEEIQSKKDMRLSFLSSAKRSQESEQLVIDKNKVRKQFMERKIGSIKSQRNMMNSVSSQKHNDLNNSKIYDSRIKSSRARSRQRADKKFKNISLIISGMKKIMDDDQEDLNILKSCRI